jgi:hypothetical protein
MSNQKRIGLEGTIKAYAASGRTGLGAAIGRCRLGSLSETDCVAGREDSNSRISNGGTCCRMELIRKSSSATQPGRNQQLDAAAAIIEI